MSDTPEWYVTDYPVEGSFAVTDGYDIFAMISGGKTVGDECDLANRIAKLPDVERERDKAMKDAAQLADRLSGLELRTTEELARLEQSRDEWAAMCGRYKQERDEARDILRLYRQQIVMESSWSATDNFAKRMEAAK